MIFHLANAEVYEECPITNAVLSQQNMFIFIKQHVDLRLFKLNVCSHNTILYNEFALSSSICANNCLNKLMHFIHYSCCLKINLMICYILIKIQMISHNILNYLFIAYLWGTLHKIQLQLNYTISINITFAVSTNIQLMLLNYSNTNIGHQISFTET